MRIAFLADPNNTHTRRWLAYFSNRGHACAVFCDPPVNRPIEGVEIICPRMGLLRQTIAFKAVRHAYSNNLFKAGPYASAVRHWGPDIVHGFEALAYGYATSACWTVPRVLTPWGNDIFDWPKSSKLARWLVTRALKGCTKISTNAPGLEEFLEREYEIPREKVDCFSWGVDRTIFRPGRQVEAENFGRRVGVDSDARVLLSPRLMSPYWGIGLIVDAMGEIVRRLGPNTVLVFLRGFGAPEYERELRGRVDRQGLAAHARFVPEPLTALEMAAAFNRSVAFISVPETDLLSSSVLEGMACGCAPILADLPYYHARVVDEQNGFFLRERSPEGLADAVDRALSSPDSLKTMAAHNVKLIAEKDDWPKCARRMEALYESLLAGR